MEATGAAQERFRLLFEAHYVSVLRYAWRRVDDDAAKDVAAEVFIVAWRRLDEVPSDPLAWLYAVARGVCANHRRGDERRARLLERAAVAASVSRPSSDRSLAPHLDGSSAALARALDQLSDGDREVLALIAWEGLGARDAARVLGCTLPAVTMRLHRARRRLSELLRTEIEDD